jgi:glycine betaine/choline ABC-type transport system substrate-binding protein
VVRAATLLRHPELHAAIDRLAGRISADDMRRMNHEVDGLRRDPRVVAQRFLEGL